jgi:hypothetical protein
MVCDCKVTREYNDLCADVTVKVTSANADLTRGVKNTFVFLHVFFLILHVVLLFTAFTLYHSHVVKDICPPVNVCAPCAPCPPVPVYKPCATIEAWQVHITPNTSEPTCGACPSDECTPCPPVPMYKPCDTIESWQVHITPNTSEPTCGACPSYECTPVVQCPKDNKHYDNCATLWAEAGY